MCNSLVEANPDSYKGSSLKLLNRCLARSVWGLQTTRNALISITFAAFLASAASGQDSRIQQRFGDKDFRQSTLQEWNSEFIKLNAQIPTLSPAEERWLETEIDETIALAGGKYTARSLAAMDSREYELRVTKPHVQKINKTLHEIQVLKSQNPGREVILWTQLAMLIMDREFWKSIESLVRRNVIRRTINGLDSLYYENHVLWARGILDGIVIPHLNQNRRP